VAAEPEKPRAVTGRLQLAAALLASSVIGAPVVIATAARTVFYSINPQGIDVSHPAAYMAEVTVVFLAALVGAIVAVAIVLSRLKAQAESRDVLRVPYMILALQIAFGAVSVALFLFTPRI
jgi:hypothetical protein